MNTRATNDFTDIPTIHLKWIFDAAHKEFTGDMERLETERLRHQRMIEQDEPLYWSKHSLYPQNRVERVDKIKLRLDEMSRLLEFVNIARISLMEQAAGQDAAAFWHYMAGRNPEYTSQPSKSGNTQLAAEAQRTRRSKQERT